MKRYTVTPQMILDKMDQLIRLGFVNARMPEKMRVKVTLPDTPGGALVTKWLPVLCPRACGDLHYDLPDVGDQVLCVFLAYGLEQGFVIGSMYGRQDPPVQNADKWCRQFRDGTTLEYDRAAHRLTAHVRGECDVTATGAVTMKAGGPLTLEAPIIYLRGTLVNTASDGSPGTAVISGGVEVLDGGISVPGGDVMAAGVSLVSHTTDGVMPGSGTSSHPTGGSAESPGTTTMPMPLFGTPAYAASIAASLENLAAYVEKSTSPHKADDQLILCLPAIAAAKMEEESNTLDKKGWEYLHEMFELWLGNVANTYADTCAEPYRVEWKWLFAFTRASRAYDIITEPNYLFSENAKKLLAKRLERVGKLTDRREPFDFISENWRKWPASYFQSKAVERQQIPTDPPDGLMAAMGAFMIYALAKGYSEPCGRGHKIVIEDVALVVYDRFNFEGPGTYKYWRCSPPDFSYQDESGYTEVTNDKFNAFRNFYGRGYDFAVISGPHDLEIQRAVEYETSL